MAASADVTSAPRIGLSAKLAIFAARAGETIPRHELVGDDSEVGERTIDVQINRLRRKIERDPSNPSAARPDWTDRARS